MVMFSLRRKLVVGNKKSLALILGICLFVSLLFIWRIGSLTPGLSPTEKQAVSDSQSVKAIADNPVNAPHKAVQLLLDRSGVPGAAAWRLASVAFTVLFMLCFFTIVRTWFGRMVGILSTFLLASIPLLVISGRQASPEIMFLSPVVLLASYYWLLRTQKHYKIAWMVLFAATALCLYVPGLIWWIVAGVLIARSRLVSVFKNIPRMITAGGVVFMLVLITPLILAIAGDWAVLRNLLLIPEQWPEPLTALKSVGWMTLALIWKSPYHYPLVLDRLPVLNLILIALAVFGVYAMLTNAKKKAYSLWAMVAFGILTAALNQAPALLIFSLPAIAVLAGAGLRYLHVEWTSIFPRNPLPRALAVALMIALVFTHMLFGIRYSLIAWPHSVDTRQLYVLE
jgi:hypothetical protein